MKDIYKQKVDNTIESISTRVKVVKEMVTGERPADPKQADTYLREVLKSLEEIQETISRG
jgi:flagellar motor switch protein FliM